MVLATVIVTTSIRSESVSDRLDDLRLYNLVTKGNFYLKRWWETRLCRLRVLSSLVPGIADGLALILVPLLVNQSVLN